MPFDPTLPHPLPEIDPQLFDELLGESERFVDRCDYRVMSDELPTRFLDFWLMPVGRTDEETERYRELYRSDEKGVLLQLPLHLFDYVYRRRFDRPDEGKVGEPATEQIAEALEQFCSNAAFRADVELFSKRFHQFHALLQYIRIVQGMGLAAHMIRFDLFDAEAYDEVLTEILVGANEFLLRLLVVYEQPYGNA